LSFKISRTNSIGIVSSVKPTATFGTDVSRLLIRGCGTALQLVLGKQTSAMNSLSCC